MRAETLTTSLILLASLVEQSWQLRRLDESPSGLECPGYSQVFAVHQCKAFVSVAIFPVDPVSLDWEGLTSMLRT